jgi:simple sugar transport system ATP-binding protein
MVVSYSVADNLVLNTYNQEPFARGININQPAILEHAKELIKRFDVRTPGPNTHAGSLSGGNQQKMVVARELSRPLKLLIASQPTRGIDVGSIEFIHNQIVRKRDDGVAVLLVSSELDEIMALSDRIVVMYKGEIIGTVPAAEATREGIGLLMAGVHAEAKPPAPGSTSAE